jgi:uncharacterized protein (DUF58 family)
VRRYLITFAVVGGILAAAFALRSGFLAYAMYALLLVYVASLIMSTLSLRGIECRREINQTEVNIADVVHVTLTVKNTNPWPIPWVFLDERRPGTYPVKGDSARLQMFLPGQQIHMMYTVRFYKRGYHRLGPLTTESGDIFGLHRRFRVGAARDYVTVLPRVMVIGEYDIGSRKPIGEIRFAHRMYEDPTRISGVREYVPGDSLNRIHWKLTAATGNLYSKTYDPSVVTGATIALDFHEGGYQDDKGEERAELAVVTAASLANFVFSSGEQVGYFTNGRDAAERGLELKRAEIVGNRLAAQQIADAEGKSDRLRPLQVPTGRGAAQVLHILESLARTELTDGLTMDRSLEHAYRRFRRDATLLLLVPQVSEQLAVMLGALKSAGFSIAVFVILNPAGCDAAQELLIGLDIPVMEIDGEHRLNALAFGEVPF